MKIYKIFEKEWSRESNSNEWGEEECDYQIQIQIQMTQSGSCKNQGHGMRLSLN